MYIITIFQKMFNKDYYGDDDVDDKKPVFSDDSDLDLESKIYSYTKDHAQAQLETYLLR